MLCSCNPTYHLGTREVCDGLHACFWLEGQHLQPATCSKRPEHFALLNPALGPPSLSLVILVRSCPLGSTRSISFAAAVVTPSWMAALSANLLVSSTSIRTQLGSHWSSAPRVASSSAIALPARPLSVSLAPSLFHTLPNRPLRSVGWNPFKLHTGVRTLDDLA